MEWLFVVGFMLTLLVGAALSPDGQAALKYYRAWLTWKLRRG